MAHRPIFELLPWHSLPTVGVWTSDLQSTASEPGVTVWQGDGTVPGDILGCLEVASSVEKTKMLLNILKCTRQVPLHSCPNKELSNPKCPQYQGYSSKGDRETSSFWKWQGQRTQEHVRHMGSQRKWRCLDKAAVVLQQCTRGSTEMPGLGTKPPTNSLALPEIPWVTLPPSVN